MHNEHAASVIGVINGCYGASALATVTFASTYRWMVDGTEVSTAAV